MPAPSTPEPAPPRSGRPRRSRAVQGLIDAGSLAFWTFLTLSSIALFPVALLVWATTVCWDRRLRALHLFTCFWASLYTWLNPAWRVVVQGRERIRRDVAYVMVANHQSLLDILVLFRLFVHFKWVSKIENFRIPFVGWNMRLNRYVPLVRGDRRSARAMLDACARLLRSGSSVMIFPEGTRSVTGVLRSFKPGAFLLAKRTGRPLLPIAISGTASALPKKGVRLRGRHHIVVRVLEEIPREIVSSRTVEELIALTRGRIQAALADRPVGRAGEGPWGDADAPATSGPGA